MNLIKNLTRKELAIYLSVSLVFKSIMVLGGVM